MDKMAYMQHRFQLCKNAGVGTWLGRHLYRLFGTEGDAVAQTARMLHEAKPLTTQITQLGLRPNSGVSRISYTAAPGNTRNILVQAHDAGGKTLASKNLSPHALDAATLKELSESAGRSVSRQLDTATLNELNNQALAVAAANPHFSRLGRKVIGGGLATTGAATTGAGLLYAGTPSSTARNYQGPYLT